MLTESHFHAPWWARNPHLQTILPKWLRRSPARFIQERFELPDGDFVDLAWSGEPGQDEQPLVVVFHGLEGSIHSHYAKGLFAHLQRQGNEAVLMHFRGCSGEPNRLLQAYHSGAIEDAQTVIAELGRRFPGRPLVAIGYSLGGNMLVNLLARACPAPLKAAVVVSAPLQLASCADRVNQGFSRVYQNYLLRTMRTNLQSKIRRQSAARARWQPAQITRIATLREFDELVTAPLHGFESADQLLPDLLRPGPAGPHSHPDPRHSRRRRSLHDRCRHSGGGAALPSGALRAEPPGRPRGLPARLSLAPPFLAG